MFKSYLVKTALDVAQQSYENIESLFDRSKPGVLLDVGCWDGMLTMRWAKKLGAKSVWGIEVVDLAITKARKAGVNKVFKEDLNHKWSLDTESVDVIVASQVIEHLWDTDMFVSEIGRVLKKGGYAIIATDNLAGWHNIGALLLGWQVFPLTNISKLRLGLGNPMALCRGQKYEGDMPSHQRIFTIGALKELVELHGLKPEKITVCGWLPLPRGLANLILKIDRVHSVGFELKLRKV